MKKVIKIISIVLTSLIICAGLLVAIVLAGIQGFRNEAYMQERIYRASNGYSLSLIERAP